MRLLLILVDLGLQWLTTLKMNYEVTYIDNTTNLVELVHIDNKSSDALLENLNKPG